MMCCWYASCYTFSMGSKLVDVFMKLNKMGLAHPLQSTHSCTLEVQMCLEVLSNFSYQTLEGNLMNHKFSGFPITSSFMECHGSRPDVKVLVSCFYSQLLPWCFPTSRFVGSLLCMSQPWYKDFLLWLELSELEAVRVWWQLQTYTRTNF